MGTDRPWKIAGLGFHHGHIAEQLRTALARDDAEIVAVHHAERSRMDSICDELGIPAEVRFDDAADLLDARPDIVILCSATSDHAGWVETIAEHGGAHLLVEKPFAASAGEAQRMIAAQARTGHRLVVNWPLAYYPVHRRARRLLADGVVGSVRELHYYDGNRGPFSRMSPDAVGESDAWWFDPEQGGGSLHDYLGYGVTLASWFLDGEAPRSISAMAHRPPGSRVDTHAVVTAEYAWGLATFQTRWGMLSDPWVQQSLPRTGFLVAGTDAALRSIDYADAVRVHDADRPDGFEVPAEPGDKGRTALAELIEAIDSGRPISGPASPELSLLGQRIVDAAVQSSATGAAVEL